MASATAVRSASCGSASTIARTTPGPEMPTLMTSSASPVPWTRAGHERVVLDHVGEHHELGAADAVAVGGERGGRRTMTCAMRATASMLMPARVVATFTEEQTRSVAASAAGIERDERVVAAPMPLCTSAEKPPMKSTPTSCAARSIARASGVRSSHAHAAATEAIGVTEMRLLTIGMPYSRSIASQTGTSRSAARVTRS